MFGPNEMFSPTKKNRRSRRTKTPKRSTPKKKTPRKSTPKKKTPKKSTPKKRGKSKSAKKKTPKKSTPAVKKKTPVKIKATSAGTTTSSSWLDELQKTAQESELDHTNTSPEMFVFFVLAQVVVTQLIATYAIKSPRFTMMAVFGIGSHWIGFILSMLLKTNKFYDITEDISILAMLWWSYTTIEDGEPSVRQKICYICAGIWCLRLLAFVGYRVIIRGSDFRFDKLNAYGKAYSFFAWTSGGTWCFMNFFALWRLADLSPDDTSNKLDALDLVGFFLFAFGLGIETVADLQKYAFNARFASGKNNKWISSGLWSYSRHPNYCGEILLCLGLALVSMGGMDQMKSMDITNIAIVLTTPIWSMVFLVFTSLMLLEKKADKKWGRQKAYQNYKQNVPVLFPFV